MVADSNLSTTRKHLNSRLKFSLGRVFGRHWRESLAYYGLGRSLHELSTAIYRVLADLWPSRRKSKYGDIEYDWEHSVDTTRANLTFRTQLTASLAGHEYFASEPWLFAEIMRALPIDFHEFIFVDLGSGKGRTLLMASHSPFRRIVGVELLPELHAIAQKNIATYSSAQQRCKSIESVCMDARDYQFPAGPLAVYCFNSFFEPAFATVLDNLRKSMEQDWRPVYVAYRYLEFENLLAESGWLHKIVGTEQWAIYANVPKH
jgi:hypothetical protein